VFASSIVPLCKYWLATSAPQAPSSALPPVPTLIVAGLDDLRTPAEDALALARSTPHSHLLLVPDAGHSVISQSGCAKRAFAHFLAGEVIGECHRTAKHKPEPAKHVRSLSADFNKLLDSIPSN
jgi:fermentation-respiration switch protein FrsA (DUF1100 family)